MYVCRTLERTVTVVAREEPDGEGVWEMTPHPNLLADPSIPRHNRGFVGFFRGDAFFVGMTGGDRCRR